MSNPWAAYLLGPSAGLLELTKAADLLTGLPKALRHGRMLSVLNANRAALGLGGVSALRWIKATGGKIPYVAVALTAADVALNWHQKGLGDADTQGAIVLGGGGVAATMVAGPLGAIAWEAGTLIGTGITNIPVGGGRNLGQAMGSASFDLAYGEVATMPERSREWYRTATPEQMAAEQEAIDSALRESKRIVERTSKPWLYGYDVARGGLGRLGRIVGLG